MREQLFKSRFVKRGAILEGDIAKISLDIYGYRYAVIDADMIHLADTNWRYSEGYAKRLGDLQYLHRVVMGCPADLLVDHKDHDPLNNRRTNLRICTRSDNNQHKHKQSNNHSGFKGVFLESRSQKWIARITKMQKTYHIGTFSTAIDAAKAYDEKAIELHGEFAKLNFDGGII